VQSDTPQNVYNYSMNAL